MDRGILKSFIGLGVALSAAPVIGDDIGGGRGDDIPDAPPPSDPAPAETSESFLQELIDLFHLDNEPQQ